MAMNHMHWNKPSGLLHIMPSTSSTNSYKHQHSKLVHATGQAREFRLTLYGMHAWLIQLCQSADQYARVISTFHLLCILSFISALYSFPCEIISTCHTRLPTGAYCFPSSLYLGPPQGLLNGQIHSWCWPSWIAAPDVGGEGGLVGRWSGKVAFGWGRCLFVPID